MQAALADSHHAAGVHEQAGWQRHAAAIAAILLGIIFLVSGGWKVLSPLRTGELLEQAQVPAGWGPIGAAVLGTLELFTAALLFIPRLRRWGGILGSGLLIFFIAWVAFYYNKLAGQECSCFPLIKRTVGPGFFIGDTIMLLLGVAAFAWSTRVAKTRLPVYLLTVLVAAAGLSFAVNKLSQKTEVPTPVVVDGKPADLSKGKVFLFFYDPSCMHCDAAAKFMSKMDWGTTRLVSIPTVNPQWAASFLHDTHLKAETSTELKKLKTAFPFVDPPFGVALNNGHALQTFSQAQFNEPLPKADLQKLGFIK